MTTYATYVATGTGLSHESKGLPNEDRAVVVEQSGRIWMAVFDGVSQGGGGAAAASISSECMESFLRNSEGGDISKMGIGIMKEAQTAILKTGKEHPEYGKMQTTGVIACIDMEERTLTWFSIGDSAAFVRSRWGRMEKLTTEDTEIGEKLARREISMQDAAKAAVGHELKRWLGMPEVPPASIGDYVQYGQRRLKPKDSVLVCSDGFFTKVPSKTVSRLIGSNAPSELYIKEARRNDSQDDITIILAKPKGKQYLVPFRVCIAMSAFSVAAGLLLGTMLSSRKQISGQQPTPVMQPEIFTKDTATINCKEYEILMTASARQRE